jgi:MOSC domain-containing protein YiiM
MPDDDVCVGDRYRIGDAKFEVTQPRVPASRSACAWGAAYAGA